MGNTQSEQQKGKGILKNENNLKNLWNNIKYNNICITGLSQGKERARFRKVF